MGQDDLKFPKCDLPDSPHQPELIIRDFAMKNYHINSHKMRWLKDVIDITDAHRFVDDFDTFISPVAADGVENIFAWDETVSNVATAALTDMVNGVLLLSTGQTENDAIELVKPFEAFKCVDCYPLYAEIRFKISEAIQSDFWFGLVIDQGWFGTPDEAIIFESVDGDASIRFVTRTGGVQTLADTGIDLADGTWIRLGFHWDGDGTVRYFVIADGNAPQTILAAGAHTTHIPTTELQLGFGIRSGDSGAQLLYIDYVKCVQLRVIE